MVASTSCISIAVVFTWKPCLKHKPPSCTRTHIYTHMHWHTAPREYMETMTGSTLAGPPLYLPIHPHFLRRLWVMASGDTGWSEEMEKIPLLLPSSLHRWRKKHGGEGRVVVCQICLAQDRTILNPAAFCRLPELLELCSLEVSSCWPVVSFRVSHLGIKVGLRKG